MYQVGSSCIYDFVSYKIDDIGSVGNPASRSSDLVFGLSLSRISRSSAVVLLVPVCVVCRRRRQSFVDYL